MVSMETDGSFTEGHSLSLLQAEDSMGAGLTQQEGTWLGFRATVSAVLLLELLLGVGGNLTVLILYCGHCSLLESVSHAVTLSLHTLDLLLCLLCLPITATLLILGGASVPHNALLCCLHESAASFASVGTALNLLLISLDRYDISVRPANRLLTPQRATILLVSVWVVSLAVPLLPFVEAGFVLGQGEGMLVHSNITVLCSEWGGTLQAHLLLQVPVFLCSLTVMLFTYSRILQALRIRIGRTPRPHRDNKRPAHRLWLRRKRSTRSPDHTMRNTPISPPPISTEPLIASDAVTMVTINNETNTTPLSPTPTVSVISTPLSPTASMSIPTSPHIPTPATPSVCVKTTLSPMPTVSTVTTQVSPAPVHGPPSMGVGASVSAILALRRAVRRHRDRRERQRRVFRMSVIIILSFLLCWAPLSIMPLLMLAIGPSDWLERLRLCFLVLAYWTVVLHPLLYAFTRQKLRKVLHTRLRRLRPQNTQTCIRTNTRIRRKHRTDCSDATDRCLMEAVRE
ncbi:G-protein coupled receptor 22-like [Myxocyprinus asiaticus]|uniref:G-protein coupled receptor 22-like n=1 Tax=Myxocyprinus asiaticus TaxID=70543 RepID=UPI0022233D96|nr:G-protein coupled receptor 22-like [Myxocyprinus asiaticus]